jgi:hypothetical protein
VSGYRLGQIRIADAQAGPLDLDGDGFAAAGETITLLPNSSVAKYLGLSAEEERKAREIVDAYRSALTRVSSASDAWVPPSLDDRARAARTDLARAVEELLGAERASRLTALSWRVRDGFALVDDDVATQLGLTAAQRKTIREAAAEEEQNNQRVLHDLSRGRPQGQAGRTRPASHQPIEDAGRDFVRRGSERLLSLLTPEQRQRFDAMKRGTP